jgi:hypothetical protein
VGVDSVVVGEEEGDVMLLVVELVVEACFDIASSLEVAVAAVFVAVAVGIVAVAVVSVGIVVDSEVVGVH